MAKVVRKKTAAKGKPKWPLYNCKIKNCKRPSVYMKRNRKTEEMDHWCAVHWKSEVEAKNPDAYKSQEKRIVSTPKGRRVRKIKKR